MKENVLKLKNYIKSLVEDQKVNKLNRKEVHLPENFKRVKSSWSAAIDAVELRNTLRCAYIAYAILRGKDDMFLSRIDSGWSHIKYDGTTKDILKKYAEKSTESVEPAA